MTTEPAIEHILREGRQAHIAIVSRRGPHVTPELYAWAEGRLWFWFARTTLKARVLATSPEVAVLVTVGGRSAVIEGTVDLIDVRRPATLLGTPARALRASKATGAYVARNAEDLAAFTRDLATGRLGWRLPPARILASVEVRSSILVDEDRTTEAAMEPTGRRSAGERVVVALPGPTALPGRWFADAAELVVDPALLERAGVGRTTAVAIVADDYVAPGPAAKVGTLVRGTATRGSGTGTLRVDADSVTSWDGIDVTSH
ncbi:MAG: hypothetical protein JWO77_3388 [Ilumatobacteraceae bacterium]|nr:hypothetical protein [Ilumatobacteraceae bacterium]